MSYGPGRPRKGEVRVPPEPVPVEGPFGRGRPRKGEVRKGATKGRRERQPRPVAAAFSLGIDYIELLNTMSDALQVNKSAIVRTCINRLALRFGLPPAEYEYDEAEYRPATGSVGNDAMFSLGDNFKELLDKMGDIRMRANIGKRKEVRLNGGKTQLLRDEIDRYAAELGHEPIKPLTEKVIASG